jgi:hypothetical protein
MVILGFSLYKWFDDPLYGINGDHALIYMGCLYGGALVIYLVSRLVRRRQGMDMRMVYGEIPAE